MFKAFLSYSHEDEWLKDEFLKHLKAMERDKTIDVWHDRKILPGTKFENYISDNAKDASIFLFLVSSDFINSDYCICKEYEYAREKERNGDAIIVPIIVRQCDWNVSGLQDYLALPKDAKAVADSTAKAEPHLRDTQWNQVAKGIRDLVDELKKKRIPPDLKTEYDENLFLTDMIKHPIMERFDARRILVDPILYDEENNNQIDDIAVLRDRILTEKASVIFGEDRCGKTHIAKLLQIHLSQSGESTVLISGEEIKNVDFNTLVKKRIETQFNNVNSLVSIFNIIIDDFDSCALSDDQKSKILSYIKDNYRRVILLSFDSSPSVFYASDSMPNPAIFGVLRLTDDRVFQLIEGWYKIYSNEENTSDSNIVRKNSDVLRLFSQTGIPKSPYSVLNFLQLLDNTSANDLNATTYAALYDNLLNKRLAEIGFPVGELDEKKNFLCEFAYLMFFKNRAPTASTDDFKELTDRYEKEYFSEKGTLQRIVNGRVLSIAGQNITHHETYIWFFLVARYAVKFLSKNNICEFYKIVDDCTRNVHQKMYANILIFIAYLSDEPYVLKSLHSVLDSIFSAADDFRLSDDRRDILLGFADADRLNIDSNTEFRKNRERLLRNGIDDILYRSKEVVARITLPFDDGYPDVIDDVDEVTSVRVDVDSYMNSVTALLRIHSVIGHILATRPGTYKSEIVITSIEKMVEASGRYATLNHAIAANLIYNREKYTAEADELSDFEGDSGSTKIDKLTKIFSFWSVYLSQAGLARFLRNSHCLRALRKLSLEREIDDDSQSNRPYNYTSIYLIAKLYAQNSISRDDMDLVKKKYGEHSGLYALLRTAVHIFSYYMPIKYSEKQRISMQLNMKLGSMRVQENRAHKSDKK